MTQAWVSVLLFVVLLALVPLGLKWLQARASGGKLSGVAGVSRVVSAVSVGTHHRVVTVEVGPPEARVWLTLGVTPQHISCLHTSVAPVAFASSLVQTQATSMVDPS
ncbi:flagellar biosynthetic protein FliO [Rhodoferax sp.]|uniref:flagellar biosynthetic protein FliO n=1 Tax=Rhodoferax sp. TaxID=50421 RepID=UPI0026270693|nr:flagellar biosynthetic protein FliO [Rhodoferax sp.]MDD2808250.1 flagellar biosynthetic protein FliO [Rhodoferax sp.]